jgi:hypothetical protein
MAAWRGVAFSQRVAKKLPEKTEYKYLLSDII